MSDAVKQSVVRMAKMIRPLNTYGTVNEYRYVEYYSREWGWLVESGFVTMDTFEVPHV